MALSLRLARAARLSSSTLSAATSASASAALRPAVFLCHHCRLSSSASSSPSSLPTPFSARKLSTSAVSSFSSSAPTRAAPPTASSPSSSPSTQAVDAAPLSDTQYHELADDYLEDLVGRLEELQDEREDVDVEYSQGVLTLEIGGSGSGSETRRTYVINKQPPNRQIWLSSPISGPKRYDWQQVAAAEEGGEDLSADADESSSSRGRWIYLKDGSLLDDLIREEIGLDLDEREPREDDI